MCEVWTYCVFPLLKMNNIELLWGRNHLSNPELDLIVVVVFAIKALGNCFELYFWVRPCYRGYILCFIEIMFKNPLWKKSVNVRAAGVPYNSRRKISLSDQTFKISYKFHIKFGGVPSSLPKPTNIFCLVLIYLASPEICTLKPLHSCIPFL